MTLYSIVLKNMKQRALASVLTIVSVALGVALVTGILIVRSQTEKNFYASADGWDLIVAYKGSPLEIVLNTVFNLSYASDTTPINVYERVLDDPRVEFAIPFCTGVSYRGEFPVVATTRDLYDKYEYRRGAWRTIEGRRTYLPGKQIELVRGKWFSEKRGEAVIGSFVQENSPLKMDDSFYVAPGYVDDEIARKFYSYYGQPCKVVGVMAPTGTPMDKVVYVSLNTWFNFEGHVVQPKGTDSTASQPAASQPASPPPPPAADRPPGEEEEEETAPVDPDFVGPVQHKRTFYQITSVGVRLKEGADPAEIVAEMDKGSEVAQAVIPRRELDTFFRDILGWVSALFISIAAMVIVVSSISIMVWIYNSMSERRRDIAIMRSLGAGRWTIFASILLESATLCALGALVGIPLAHFAVQLSGNYIHMQSGALINAWSFSFYEILVLVGTALLGALVGLVPATKAYETDVAAHLSPLA
ncbi:MAG: ABC transporter permease [Planctomycetota bacterium]